MTMDSPMSKTRSGFETWRVMEFPERAENWNSRDGDGYFYKEVNTAWLAWQAATMGDATTRKGGECKRCFQIACDYLTPKQIRDITGIVLAERNPTDIESEKP